MGFEAALKDKLQQKASSFQDEESVLLKCFKHFDADCDGLVDMTDWARAVEKAGIVIRFPDDLKHLFDIYDLHGQGKVDYHEFADVMFRQLPLRIPRPRPVDEKGEEETEEEDKYGCKLLM